MATLDPHGEIVDEGASKSKTTGAVGRTPPIPLRDYGEPHPPVRANAPWLVAALAFLIGVFVMGGVWLAFSGRGSSESASGAVTAPAAVSQPSSAAAPAAVSPTGGSAPSASKEAPPPSALSLGPGEVRRLVSWSGDNYTPAISLDARWLGWINNAGGVWRIIVGRLAALDTTSAEVPGQAGDNQRVHFSPEGSEIAFASNQTGNYQIYLMNRDGSNLRRLTNGSWDSQYPSFSPDGQSLAFMTNQSGELKIATMQRNGGGVRQITRGPGRDAYPAFSPDGKRIAFDSTRSGNVEIYTVGTDESNLLQLTRNPARDAVPSYSPDGKWITFESNRARDHHEIHVMAVNGDNPRSLTSHAGDYGDFVASVSHDGQWLLYQSNRAGHHEVYLQEFRP